jgi:CPA1 family monovalent cation:H+ antiporter
MHAVELILGLLVAVAALVTLARRIQVPYPILLVIGGTGLSLVPGLPHVELEPDLVFLVFLPPILYAAAYLSSLRELRDNLKPISLLAIGLVLLTTVAVAAVAHALVKDLSWAAAFALGAIVAPSDAVATTAIAQRLGTPRRLTAIIEGESLVNDATALVAYRLAIMAAATGTFSASEATIQFVWVAVGGIAIGLIVGWLLIWLWRHLDDPSVEILLSFLAAYAAYLPAEALGVSGVLASVIAGLYVGRRQARVRGSKSRIQGRAVWDNSIFLINGLVFILIGLQMAGIVERLVDRDFVWLIGAGALVSLTVILARFVWLIPATYLPYWLVPSLRTSHPAPPWQGLVVLGWSGMRGVVSLAAALSLPFTLTNGESFPERDVLVFLTFCVILVTLVGQGLTLPWLIQRLGVGEDGTPEHEAVHAREVAVTAAQQRIEALAEEWPGHLPLIETLRSQYAHRASHLAEHTHDDHDRPIFNHEAEQEMLEHSQIRKSIINAERDAVIDLRDRGVITDDILRQLEQDLDLEELRMEA